MHKITQLHTQALHRHMHTHTHTHIYTHKHYTDMLCEIRTAHYFGNSVESGPCLKEHSDQTGVTIVGCSCQCSVSQLQRGGGRHVLLVVESKNLNDHLISNRLRTVIKASYQPSVFSHC